MYQPEHQQDQSQVQQTPIAAYNPPNHRSFPKEPEINRFRRRKWVWMMAVIDSVLAIVVVGRFFHYVANDARISNTPPSSELEDRISLLWTWFAFLAAYVCQLLMSVALVLSTQMNEEETVLGNCQLYLYGAHVLHLYTFVEFMIICYCWIFLGYFSIEPGRKYIVAIFVFAKMMFRGSVFFCVKYFMSDLNKPSCTCGQVVPDDDMQSNLIPRQSWPSR